MFDQWFGRLCVMGNYYLTHVPIHVANGEASNIGLGANGDQGRCGAAIVMS